MAILTSLPNILPRSVLDRLPAWVVRLQIPLGIDLQGGSRLVLQVDPMDVALQTSGGVDAVIAVMRRRLDQAGAAFAHYRISRLGKEQIKIEVPALFDVDLLKSLVTTVAKLAIYPSYQGMNADDIIMERADLPADAQIFYDHDGDPPISYLVHNQPLLTSEDIEAIHLTQDTAEFSHIDIGTQRKIDTALATKSRSLIAVLDGEVIANAHLNDAHGFTLARLVSDFAENLSIVLHAGTLPIPTHVLEERTVGVDQGGEFAQAGKQAILGALLIMAVFMIACYGMLGLIANLVLTVNLALLASILSLNGLPLTLAGFAGLVLTVGIAVDALILIYERIREERRSGAALSTALDAGFLRARSTIIDANITTLLGAMMLFLFGTGPIFGFAMTVAIGICVSLFTSLIFARFLLGLWLHYGKPQDMGKRLLQLVPNQTSIPFMRLRRFFLGLSLSSVCLTVILHASVGLHYGIDFSGGSLAVLTPYRGDVDITDIANRVEALNIGNVNLQKSPDGDSVHLTIPSQIMGESADQSVALKLRGEFDADYQLEKMDVVGPSLSGQFSLVSIGAVFLSLVAIFLYVWVRFNWKFGLGALISTLHDVIVLLLVFIVTGWEFNLWSVAALLAIIGYSLNDTIVVYDRIRSLLLRERTMKLATLVDLAINRTLSRTVLTSLATLLAHIPLYYYGGADIRNFASVLLIGILIGTVSSIFIAGPLLVVLKVGQSREKVNKHG